MFEVFAFTCSRLSNMAIIFSFSHAVFFLFFTVLD